MNIHELNEKQPSATDYIAFDDGTDTYKAQVQDVLDGVDLAENNVTFTSEDTSGYPTERKTMTPLFASGSMSSLMAYISKAISNLRFALNRLEWLADRIGTGSISSVGQSIVAAIGNTSIGGVTISRAISNILEKVGDTAMGTTATTITGAIAEHESDISSLNSKVNAAAPIITNGVITGTKPTIRYGNGIATIEFTHQIPAGTYSTTDALWTVNKPPSGTIHFILSVGLDYKLMRLLPNGDITFHTLITLSSAVYLIGHVTYAYV